MNITLISKYLIYLRKLKNYTQETLANELEISRQAVSKWETGTSLPDIDILLKLSKLYDKTINQILEPHIENRITTFEEILSIDTSYLKNILMTFEISDIVKASMGSSPTVNALLKKLFPDIDFTKERAAIGNVRIDEIENIHSQIVSIINISEN